MRCCKPPLTFTAKSTFTQAIFSCFRIRLVWVDPKRRRRSAFEHDQPCERAEGEWGLALVKAIQKIVRQGNSAMVTIPRQLMFAAGLLPGALVVWELLEDRTLTLHEWRDNTVQQNRTPRIVSNGPDKVPA
jgi:hypothetical protein